MHKLSTGSAKNYILEAFLKQDKEGTISNQMINNQLLTQQMNNSTNPLNSISKPISNQIGTNQLGSNNQTNGAENNAFTNNE